MSSDESHGEKSPPTEPSSAPADAGGGAGGAPDGADGNTPSARVDRPLGPTPPPPSIVAKLWRNPVTAAILFLNVGVFALGMIFETHEEWIRWGATDRGSVWSGQWWRFITPMFLHANLLHVFLNSLVIYWIGTVIERPFGRLRFAVFYLVCGVFSLAVSMTVQDVRGIGASGAVYGLFGLLVVVVRHLHGNWRSFFADPFIRINGLLFVVITVLGATALPIDNFAHLGGLAAGIVLAVLMISTKHGPPRRGRMTRRIGGVGVAVIFVGAIVLAALPWPSRSSFSLASREFDAGLAAQRAGRPREALAHYDAAQAYGAIQPGLFLNRALAHLELGDRDAARAQGEQVVAEFPADPLALYTRALTRFETRDLRAALGDIERAMALAPPEWERRASAERMAEQLRQRLVNDEEPKTPPADDPAPGR